MSRFLSSKEDATGVSSVVLRVTESETFKMGLVGVTICRWNHACDFWKDEGFQAENEGLRAGFQFEANLAFARTAGNVASNHERDVGFLGFES